MGSVSRLLRKLIGLRPREWADLLAAQYALLAAQVLVWTRPTGQLVGGAAASAGRPASAVAPTPEREHRAHSLALAVSRAGDYGVFRPLCLVRAVAVNRLLERRGIHGSRIRIGVRMRDGKFLAHAWVEYAGRVIGDSEAHVGAFAELADVHLMDVK